MDGGRILVAGGTGAIGAPVARSMHAAGYTVRILTRRPDEARESFPQPFEIVEGDVLDPSTLGPALDGCAGLHISVSPGGSPRLEREGTGNLVAAAADARVERITYVSGSTALSENAWFPMTRAKLDAEDAIRESGLPYTVFCPTWFMETLPGFIRGKRAMVFGKFRNPWHWVSADDFARMAVRAYSEPRTIGAKLFIHGPEEYTLIQALKRYCATLAPQARVKVIPLWVLRSIAFLARRPQIGAIVPFMSYMSRVPEGGDPTEANDLLGAPTTTLADWIHERLSADEG